MKYFYKIKDGYLSGSFTVGENLFLKDVEVFETDIQIESDKVKAYRVENNTLIFDEDKYTQLLAKRQILNKKSELESQIAELKSQLTTSDYKIIKSYELSLVGKESEYDLTTLHNERQELRDLINSLEQQIATL